MSSVVIDEVRTSGPEQASSRALELGRRLRWMLVLASTGAAAIHFAFTPTYFEEYWVYGVFFVALAWLQLAWAFMLTTRPSRLVLYLGLLNVVVVVVWLASRTIGVGVGPSASISDVYGFPDTMASVLEIGIALGSGLLLWKPEIVRRQPSDSSAWPGFTIALTVALVVTLSLSLSPSLGGHSHADGGALDGGAGGAHASHTGAVSTGRKVDAKALVADTKRSVVRWENVE